MDPHTAEAFAWAVAILALWLGAVVLTLVWLNRSPRKADREYRASLRDASASYSEEGVYGDVPFVPARPFADSEGGQNV